VSGSGHKFVQPDVRAAIVPLSVTDVANAASIGLAQYLNNTLGPVTGAVVHEEHFADERIPHRRLNSLMKKRRVVEDWDEDTEHSEPTG
jgi:hypothetical protein